MATFARDHLLMQFAEFQKKAEAEHGTVFLESMADLPATGDGVKRLALISGRTADNPRLLQESIKVSKNLIYQSHLVAYSIPIIVQCTNFSPYIYNI